METSTVDDLTESITGAELMVTLMKGLLMAMETEAGSMATLTGLATLVDHQEMQQEDKTSSKITTLRCYQEKMDYGGHFNLQCLGC